MAESLDLRTPFFLLIFDEKPPFFDCQWEFPYKKALENGRYLQ